MSQTEAAPEQLAAIDFSIFLESTHPSKRKLIKNLWSQSEDNEGTNFKTVAFQPIRIHCWNDKCNGERTFRCMHGGDVFTDTQNSVDKHAFYRCGDCNESIKRFSLRLNLLEDGSGYAYKYGEAPPFGVPVSSRVLRLFGSDSSVFLKGRSCEAQGLGIGAFSYYRRMVEKHRSDLFDEIIKVCETISAPPTLISDLKRAREEISFSKAMDEIKPGIPEGLLIGGQNPLQLLHSALSVGLHDGTDEECLEAAQDVRVILTELVERISQLKKDDAALSDAVQRLAKRAAKRTTPSE